MRARGNLVDLVVLIIPGPAVVYIVSRSVHQGRRAGLVSVAGTSTGLLVHVAASVAGVSAIVLSSALAFRVLKLVGAASLIILSIKALADTRRKTDDVAGTARSFKARSMKKLFFDGIFISTFNPKPALFFTAFLPQFVDSSRGYRPSAIAW